MFYAKSLFLYLLELLQKWTTTVHLISLFSYVARTIKWNRGSNCLDLISSCSCLFEGNEKKQQKLFHSSSVTKKLLWRKRFKFRMNKLPIFILPWYRKERRKSCYIVIVWYHIILLASINKVIYGEKSTQKWKLLPAYFCLATHRIFMRGHLLLLC